MQAGGEMTMNLYYAKGDQQVGPIGKAELQTLIKAKQLNARTLVWQPGMENWQQLGVFIRSRTGQVQPAPSPTAGVKQSRCSECGLRFAEDEMIQFQHSWVCAACKPLFVQKIKEGVTVAGAMNYAGFWIRFGAFGIDALILGIANFLLFIPLGILTPASEENPFVFLSFMPLLVLFQYAIPAVYDTWFVGKYGATPGKMACNLKVVVEDSSRMTYLRALGRHFAKWLSSMILAIGFIMAAFDDQKRTLHDRICETRVVRK
jgi:uncharacterized RDD family membrane protein YckC